MRKGAIGLRRHVFVGAVASLAVLLGLVTAGSVPTVAWAATKFHSAPTPKISGTVRVGSKLTAKPGTWRPRASLKYQWKLSGKSVSGARKSTWVVPASAKGKTITVTVTGSRKGYRTTARTSKATRKAAAGVFTAPTPRISGTVWVGSRLTASPGTWKPSATLTYQWKRSGHGISGATKSTYNLTASDTGKAITVTVTGSKSGYITTSKTSAAVNIPAGAAERSALIDLYNATHGPGWYIHTRWNTTASVCTWYGVTCTNGRVTRLALKDNNLSGSVPTTLGNLTRLTNLELSYNHQLSGRIPTSLGNLTQLTHLDLDENQLSGSIPTSLGNLTQLTTLNLYYNQLSGNIPTQLGDLTQLTYVDLFNNQLSGSIPTSLGNLTQLTHLDLGGNRLSGSIPTSLGNLTQLTYLDLYGDQLSGSIPASLGNLTQLTHLDFGDDQLSGSIPGSLGNLTQLTWLNLYYDQLSGPVPASLQKLTKLTDLDLHGNGCLTASGSLATWLTSLDSGWDEGCTG